MGEEKKERRGRRKGTTRAEERVKERMKEGKVTNTGPCSAILGKDLKRRKNEPRNETNQHGTRCRGGREERTKESERTTEGEMEGRKERKLIVRSIINFLFLLSPDRSSLLAKGETAPP